MTLRKATICHQTVTDHHATLLLLINPELTDLKGHFPEFPLLPGITQIDWAIFYAKQLLNCPTVFKGMEVIKFQEPILANSQVELSLQWNSEKEKLYFSYASHKGGESKQHSSGRIKLGNQ